VLAGKEFAVLAGTAKFEERRSDLEAGRSTTRESARLVERRPG